MLPPKSLRPRRLARASQRRADHSLDCASPVILRPTSGNRCGHDPQAPRFHLVQLPEDANHARPALLRKAIAHTDAYYTHPQDRRWDTLSQSGRHARIRRRLDALVIEGQSDPAAQHALTHQLTHWRKPRSERREGVVCVLKFLLAYTDIITLTIAIPNDEAWLGLNVPWIAKHTGLSESRVKRVLTTLSDAHWVTSTGRGRHYDRRQRRWIGTGWGPVRQLSWHAIRALRLEVSWQRAQRKIHKVRRTAQRSAATPDTPRSGPLAALLPPAPLTPQVQRQHARALRQALTPHPGETARTTDQATLERNRRLAELATQGYSPAEIRQLLKTGPPHDPDPT